MSEGGGSYLLDSKQALGILPTWSFWKQPEVWKVARIFVTNVGTVAVVLSCMAGAFATSLTGAFLGIAGATLMFYPFSLGLLERHVRRRAREGRLYPLREADPKLL